MKPLDPQFVLDAACQRYDITRDEIRGASRHPKTVFLRCLLAFIMHERCGLSYMQISLLLRGGKTGHSTVLNCVKRFRTALNGSGVMHVGRPRGVPFFVDDELDAMLDLLGRREAA